MTTIKAIIAGIKLGETELEDEFIEVTLKILRDVPGENEKIFDRLKKVLVLGKATVTLSENW